VTQDDDEHVHFDGRPTTYQGPGGIFPDPLLAKLREMHGPSGRPDIPPELERIMLERAWRRASKGTQ
jgi:hypothetical protein